MMYKTSFIIRIAERLINYPTDTNMKKNEPSEDDIKKVDEFNRFMLSKKLFIMNWDSMFINPETVLINGFPYTMTEGIRDFKALQKK